MASADPASASLGPRYAPEDPTLPKPWTGLIDGTTGLQYYWNPETNVTQYERPAASAPPLVPPKAETPQQYQPPQQTSNPSVPVQQMQYQLQPTPQQQMQYHPPGQPSYPQPSFSYTSQPPSQQFTRHQPVPMMPHPGQQMQNPHQPQVPYPHVQQPQPPQQVAHQHGQQGGYQKPDEVVSQYGKQGGYIPGQFQHSTVTSANVNVPVGGSQVQIPQASMHPLQQQQVLGPLLVSGQQLGGAPMPQMQQGVDEIPRQPQMGAGSRSSSQMMQGMGGNPTVTPIVPPAGVKEHGDEVHGRTRPGFYTHGPNPRDVHEMGSQQPKLAALPVAQNLQEMRSGPARSQNFALGPSPGFSMSAPRPVPNSYNKAVPGQQFANIPSVPSPGMMGSADISRSSETEIYMRQHEVTTMQGHLGFMV